jgi:sialate O-acetylesterase
MNSKNYTIKKIALVLMLTGVTSIGYCSDFRTIMSLTSGMWKFSPGDDMAWAQPSYNDTDWETIYAGKAWEEQGFVGYDGYAWYRKKVSLPEIDKSKTIIMRIENIDDCDEVYFNGSLIGKTGVMPGRYNSGYGWERCYIVPLKLINRFGENQIAVRVYDDGGDGGIIGRRMSLIYDDNEQFLDINLAGEWKFALNEYKNWKSPEYNDAQWHTLLVPMYWESQGFFNYDGYACYRKTFSVPAELLNQTLYLSLGKIDDYDKVYLNGEYIGELSKTKNKSEFTRHDGEYYTERVYEIPKNLLKDGPNSICVKVYDNSQGGGIYQGPVGIMTQEKFNSYKSKIFRDRENEEYNVDDFLKDLFDEMFN